MRGSRKCRQRGPFIVLIINLLYRRPYGPLSRSNWIRVQSIQVVQLILEGACTSFSKETYRHLRISKGFRTLCPPSGSAHGALPCAHLYSYIVRTHPQCYWQNCQLLMPNNDLEGQLANIFFLIV